eukprot:3016930-Heterocapsa_arctica.AAC.1
MAQMLNDKKEHIFIQNKCADTTWHRTSPDDKGRVGQAVIDLGVTFRTHTQASLNKGKRVAETVKLVRKVQSLALPVRDK